MLKKEISKFLNIQQNIVEYMAVFILKIAAAV